MRRVHEGIRYEAWCLLTDMGSTHLNPGHLLPVSGDGIELEGLVLATL